MKYVDISGINSNQVEPVEEKKVVQHLNDLKRSYSEARNDISDLWEDFYASYLCVPKAQQTTRSKKFVGDVNVNWRHRLKSPKAYELVETIVSYMMSAFFPNDRWFDFVPTYPIQDPNYQVILELNRRLVASKFEKSKLKQAFRIFLREVCIVGSAALMFPWMEDNVSWTVLSPFDFLLDPSSQNPNDANFIRSYQLTRPEFEKYIEDGTFSLTSKESVHYEKPRDRDLFDQDVVETLRNLQGMSGITSRVVDKVTLFEFWGDIYMHDVTLKNVRATWTSNDILLNLDSNPYPDGKPFIVGTYTRTTVSPYGIGAIQPIASQLFYKESLSNRMADNVAVAGDPMMLVSLDGVVDFDDIVIQPGKKIPVTAPNSIQAFAMPATTGVTIQELNILEQVMDKTVGTGPYVGVGQGRAGERVTAAEIAAQRDAGGKRLSDVFVDLEQESLIPMVSRFHSYCRQFYQGGSIVAFGDTFISINPSALQYDFEVKSLGASNVADKEYNLRQVMDWMATVGNNPELAQRVNWDSVLKYVTYMMLPSVAENLLAPKEQAPEQQAPPPMQEEMAQSAQFAGGNPAVRALQATEQAGQMPQEMQQLASSIGVG